MELKDSPLKDLLRRRPRICVLSGAGISAESGVPTFRDPDGLWAKFKPEELANFQAFINNPELVWSWYQHRIEVIRKVKPNPGHFALAEMAKLCTEFTLVTQNVDNLHQRAGQPEVIELHGNIERAYCLDCNTPAAADHLEKLDENQRLPRCTECNGMIRPDVVWFGEMLPEESLRRAENSAQNCELFLCVGTSGVVFPAASLPFLAKENGAYVVEINRQHTEISHVMHETLIGPSGEILPRLLAEMNHP